MSKVFIYTASLVSILLIIVCFSSCKKEVVVVEEPVVVSNPINDYVGKYEVVRRINYYSPPPVRPSDTNVIEVSVYKIDDSRVEVLGSKIAPDSNGLYQPPYGGYSVRFRNDSLFISTKDGGIARGCYKYYKGYKISNIP